MKDVGPRAIAWGASLPSSSGLVLSRASVSSPNISAEGVRLHVNGIEVIDNFVLTFPADVPAQSGTYSVAWRSGADVGAKFVSAVTQTV
jgi:hypothetical protein